MGFGSFDVSTQLRNSEFKRTIPSNSIAMKFSVCHSIYRTAAVWFNYRHSSQFTPLLQPSVLYKEHVVERIQERSLSLYRYLLPPY